LLVLPLCLCTESPDSSVPPPPSSASPADFVSSIANPKLKLGLTPVTSTKALHDGLNPNMVALQQIEKRDLKAGLKRTESLERDFFQTAEFKHQAREAEAELARTLRRNSVLLDLLKYSSPPAYPEAPEDLAEGTDKRREEDLLVKLPALEEHAPSSEAEARPSIEHLRRNSKMAYLGDIVKPLARLQLTPVGTEEQQRRERVEE
jgi:hypothetical protein